jgi:hypothetical protein
MSPASPRESRAALIQVRAMARAPGDSALRRIEPEEDAAMKDFTPTQQLLMVRAVSAAVTFAVLVAYPADGDGARAHPAPVSTRLPPF